MPLNSSKLIKEWTARYSGISLYLANSPAQSAAESGGTTPTTGFHSVIDSPERVSRVTPPTTTIKKIRPQQINNQTAITPSPSLVATFPLVGDAVADMVRARSSTKSASGKVRPPPRNDNCDERAGRSRPATSANGAWQRGSGTWAVRDIWLGQPSPSGACLRDCGSRIRESGAARGSPAQRPAFAR